MTSPRDAVMALPGLVSFWDFQQPGGQQRLAHGQGAYALHETSGTIDRIEGGVFGAYCANFTAGRWLECPREACPLLNLHGPEAEVSVLAWVRRDLQHAASSQAVAGIWHEAAHRRQYGLYLDLRQNDSAGQVAVQLSCVDAPAGHKHVGAQLACVGAPAGHKHVNEAAIGATALDGGWHFIACTFGRGANGGNEARVYLDGRLDLRAGLNPASPAGCLANGGAGGADFTVGAVHRTGEVGDWFVGALAGVAVCNRALAAETMQALHAQVALPQ
jgi:hypothetical protein